MLQSELSFIAHHKTDKGGAEGRGSLLQAEEREADTRNGHEHSRRRNNADHMRTEGTQHDRDDAADKVCCKRDVVRILKAAGGGLHHHRRHRTVWPCRTRTCVHTRHSGGEKGNTMYTMRSDAE